jgi:hypothetical protein
MLLEEIKKQERKKYKRYAFGAITGIVLGAIGFIQKGWWANVLVIARGIIVILYLHLFAAVFDMYYKLKGKLRERDTGDFFNDSYIQWPPWIKNYGWIIYFIIITLGYWLAKKHENDFDGNKFVWHSILAGLITGFMVHALLKRRYTGWGSNSYKNSEILFYIILTSVIVSVSLGPFLNECFAKSQISCETYLIVRKAKNSKTGTKYIYVKIEGRQERFNPPNSFYNKLTDADSTIILCVQRGFLGYAYVEEFKLAR